MAKKKEIAPKIDTSNSAPLQNSAPLPEGTITREDMLAQVAKMVEAAEAVREKSSIESSRAAMLLDKIERDKNNSANQKQSRNREATEFQGREFADREAIERRLWRAHNLGKLYIDPDLIPVDEVWFWAANVVAGQDNNLGINNLLNKDWVPVRPAECPELCKGNAIAEEFGKTQKNFIVNEACILLKRKKEIHEIENAILMHKLHEQEDKIVDSTNSMSDHQIDRVARTFVAVNKGARSDIGYV